MPTLVVARQAYDELLRAGEAAGDREVCGVMAGTYGERESRVAAVHPVENAAETPETRYAMAPEEQFEVLERVEAAGRDVVGFYHTHPAGPPRPSATDAARATWTGYSYAVCTLGGDYPYLGSWRWRGGAAGFERELVALDGDRP
ncbi:MAG: desampylase [Haloferacaceae archaeon]